MQAHFFPSGTRFAQVCQDSFLHDANMFGQQGRGQPARPITLNTTTTTTQPTTHDQTTRTIKTHDQKQRRLQIRRRTRRRRYATHLLPMYQQFDLHNTKATTSSALVQTTATRVSRDTHTEYNTSLSRHRCQTTLFQAAGDSERTTLFNFCFLH